MRYVVWIAIFTVVFLLWWVKYVERHNIYFPMKEIHTTPELIGLSHEEVYFRAPDDIQLHGWFIPNNMAEFTPPFRERAGFTILFCHGNGGNISHRLEKIELLHRLGLNVFIFDYRGYGKSKGSPSESGLYKDVDAAYHYLTEERKVSNHNIILYGESLGGAVAIDLAKGQDVRALITEEAFTSIKDMAKIVYPFVPSFLISNKFDSISRIKEVTCPKLIIHSINDEIAPFYLGQKLFDVAAPPKEFLKIRGSHNTAFLDSEEQLTEGIKSFLDEL